jgi:hypothetical protein
MKWQRRISIHIGSILFGGLGGHNNGDSTNDGSLALVNQTTGVVNIVGHPAGVSNTQSQKRGASARVCKSHRLSNKQTINGLL